MTKRVDNVIVNFEGTPDEFVDRNAVLLEYLLPPAPFIKSAALDKINFQIGKKLTSPHVRLKILNINRNNKQSSLFKKKMK